MRAKKLAVAGAIAVVGLSMLTGCTFFTPQQVGSEWQGGSNVLQATNKLTNDQWGSMNADDIQLLVQMAPTVIPELEDEDVPTINDSQAQTFVDFMDANDVETREDLINVIEQAAQDPSSVANYDEIVEVLGALGVDS
jgi:hypothetical protein